jgi:uncharacterized protein HemX
MKKVFIGLLIVAAGAGAFYFLQKKKAENTIEKELLTGKWTLNSLDVKTKDSSAYFLSLISAIDSNFTKYRYDFKADGNVLKSLTDSVKADSSHYEWTKKNELVWKENARDSTSEVFTVTRLTNDSLLLLSKDSTTFVFAKLK